MTGKSVLIAGGGTGGHMSPGIALYEEFRARGIRAIFLCGMNDRRFSLLDEVTPEDRLFYGAPSLTKNIFMLPIFALKFYFAMRAAGKMFRKYDIGAVIGMGGYVSAPALVAAKRRGIPLYLCEQNSVPGRVTGFFEKSCRKIYTTFEMTSLYLKCSEKIVQAGNPIRKKVFKTEPGINPKTAFHLGHEKNVILAIGGSQGAVKINDLVLGLMKKYPEEFKNIGIIWSTGSYSYDRFKEMIHSEIGEGSIYLSPFIDKVGLAYRACDIAISRAGAGVMVELAAMGVPSILMPYPHAAMNHQDRNADEFEKYGAAVKIRDSDASPEKIGAVLFGLLNNTRALKKMSDKALALAKPDAAAVIVNDILKDFQG